MESKKCTEQVRATVLKVRVGGVDKPTVVHYQYCYSGKVYIKRETLKMESVAHKVGGVVIGQVKQHKIAMPNVNDTIKVLVNPKRPSIAYIKGNVGIMNC